MKVFKKTKNIIIKINHPVRKEALQQFNKHCVAATPPSKGGETYSIVSCNIAKLKLTPIPQGGKDYNPFPPGGSPDSYREGRRFK